MKTIVALPLVVALLAGCSRDKPAAAPQAAGPVASATAAAPAVAKDPHADLMRAVFGARYRPASGNALAEMPEADNPAGRVPMVVTAAASTRLPNGQTVLAVNADMAEADGTAMAAHVSPGVLSIYVLDNTGGQWRVLRRHESVATLGSSGQIGELKWVNLARDKPGLAVLHGGTWQGATITYLALFDPLADKVADLMEDNPAVHSDNQGACGPSTPHCWQADAQWRFEPGAASYDDLVLAIKGHEDKAKHPDAGGSGDTPVERQRSSLDSTVRYVFNGSKYQRSEGENTIPGV